MYTTNGVLISLRSALRSIRNLISISFLFVVIGCDYRHEWHEWERMSSPTDEDLLSVWGSPDSDVFAVGRRNIIRRRENKWSKEVLPGDFRTGTEAGIWGRNQNDVFAVGLNGAIIHRDSTGWNMMDSGTEHSLWAVWGTPDGGVFAAGGAGTILYFEEERWSPLDSGTTGHFNELWGTSVNHMLALHSQYVDWPDWMDSCPSLEVSRYNGENWSIFYDRPSSSGYGIWGSSSRDVYIVGCDLHMIDMGVANCKSGWILHFDGTWWDRTDLGEDWIPLAVWGSSPDDVYIVGIERYFDGSFDYAPWRVNCGFVMRFDGNRWSEPECVADERLRGVWSSENDVFLVGDGGTILHHVVR